ncbi:MAG: ComF family protein [Rickettsia endosymbiont of Pentastiridius leporinus]
MSCSEILNSNGEFCCDCWKNLEFIAKPYCNICGQRFSIKILDNATCGRCYSKKPNYDLARSLFKFNEYSKKVVHQFKYQDKTIFAKTFAKLLCNRYLEDINDIDLIVPVPMNRFKRLLRMYNPPHILAEEVAKIVNIRVKADILLKSKWTKAQTFLSKRQRKNNISGSIKFNTKHNITGKKILLIDDVITTGVTINECSKVLRMAGAGSVKVISVAMT